MTDDPLPPSKTSLLPERPAVSKKEINHDELVGRELKNTFLVPSGLAYVNAAAYLGIVSHKFADHR